jgi:hypothetical protein
MKIILLISNNYNIIKMKINKIGRIKIIPTATRLAESNDPAFRFSSLTRGQHQTNTTHRKSYYL